MKRQSSPLFITSLMFVCAAQCLGQLVFIRSPFVGGNTGYYAPFDVGHTINSSMRYQQVYASSDFLSRMPRGGVINAIRFDVADRQYGGHPFGTTFSGIQINLSTTLRAVDGLSAVFVENSGPDDAIVFGPSPITLSDDADGGADVIIPLSKLFFYDPRAGNLLMDLQNFGRERASPFNANNAPDDTTSSVFSTNSVNDPTGFPFTAGLVTIFDVTPLPLLTISLQSSNLVFQWPFQQPLFEPLRFTLQQSDSLALGAAWQPAGAPITTNGGNLQVTLPLDPQMHGKFFRLIWPTPPSGAGGLQLPNKTTTLPTPEY